MIFVNHWRAGGASMVDNPIDLIAAEKGQPCRHGRTLRCPIGGHRWGSFRGFGCTTKLLQIPHDILLDPPQIFHYFRQLDVLAAQLFDEMAYNISSHLLFQVLDLCAAFSVPLWQLTE